MASHGFVLEAPSLVSIYFACALYSFKRKVTSCHLLIYQGPMFTPLYFCSLRVCAVFDHFGYPAPPIGDWRHVKWYNLRSVQQTLEEMQQRVTSGLTPLPPLQITSSFGPSAGSTASPGPPASSSHARPEVAQKAPRSKAEKLNWWPPPRSGAMVVDPRASVWKIRLHLVGLSGRSGLINLTPPTTVARNTKTHLRTPMTPMNPLTGLSQVLPRLPLPPAPPVPLPRHPSDRRGVFHSAPPASVHEQTLHQVTSWIISLV